MSEHRPAVTRVSDAVAGELELRILEGSMKPGRRLPPERELSVTMGVSRPSLREAIQKLISKGLLVSRHGGGTYVTDRLDTPFIDPWQEMLNGHPMLQSDLLEFRHMLEGQAAQLAAERATDADMARLDAAFATLADAYVGRNLAVCVDADVAFHQAIAEASHNVLIGHLSASLLRLIHGHISRNLEHMHARPLRWEQLHAQHEAIWRTVRDHKPDAAAQAAREHVEFVRQNLIDSARDEERRQSALRRLG